MKECIDKLYELESKVESLTRAVEKLERKHENNLKDWKYVKELEGEE